MRTLMLLATLVVIAAAPSGAANSQSAGRARDTAVQEQGFPAQKTGFFGVDQGTSACRAATTAGLVGGVITETGANAESLNTCMAELSRVSKFEPASGEELMYRMTIATLATHLAKRPAISVEAQWFARRGAATLEGGSEPQTLRSAQAHFHNAVLLAPWYADATYNLAQIERKLGQNENAMSDFLIYLATDRSASDATDVRAVAQDLRASVLRSTSDLIATCGRAKANADRDRRSCDELKLWNDRFGYWADLLGVFPDLKAKVADVLAERTAEPPKPPQALTSPRIEWTVTNSCNQPVRLKLYEFEDAKATFMWPATTYYGVPSEGSQRIVTSGVTVGKRMCYGAASDNGKLSWGVGLDGRGSCDRCCWTTSAGSQTREINLTCQ